MAKKDLDWLVDNFAMNSCDLWEDTKSGCDLDPAATSIVSVFFFVCFSGAPCGV